MLLVMNLWSSRVECRPLFWQEVVVVSLVVSSAAAGTTTTTTTTTGESRLRPNSTRPKVKREERAGSSPLTMPPFAPTRWCTKDGTSFHPHPTLEKSQAGLFMKFYFTPSSLWTKSREEKGAGPFNYSVKYLYTQEKGG